MIVFYLFVGLIGYLLGALPFGYLVARAKGVNIFEVGSKNPGATNVRRVLGKGPGNLVFALDALKGALAASWALLSRSEVSVTYDMEEWGLTAAGLIADNDWINLGLAGLVGAMVGHSYSCFTKFRGGKGVATGAGGVCLIIPISAAVGGVIWLLAFYSTRYVSLASILAAISLPVTVWLRGRPMPLVVMAAVLALFVVVRHRGNIRRLVQGTENRFNKHSAEPSES